MFYIKFYWHFSLLDPHTELKLDAFYRNMRGKLWIKSFFAFRVQLCLNVKMLKGRVEGWVSEGRGGSLLIRGVGGVSSILYGGGGGMIHLKATASV